MIAKTDNKLKLTKKSVETAESDPNKRLSLWDTEIRGFNVRIYPTGRKVYYLQYRNTYNMTKKLKIGAHGSITAEQAREQARFFSLKIASGEDPTEDFKSKKQEKTLNDLAESYLNFHAKVNKKHNSYVEDKRQLDNVVLPRFGKKKLGELTTYDVQCLHRDLKSKPYMANRTITLVNTMYNLAIKWGWAERNPVSGIQKYKEHPRTRWLNDSEINNLLEVLDTYHNQNVANVIRLLLLTGARRNEVLWATWDQFDLKAGVWTKPAHNTKQTKQEHLPLSSSALEIIKAMRETDPSGKYLFPGKISGKPLQTIKTAWNTIRKRAGLSGLRLHDLRHTYASHLVSSGLSLSIVGKLLGHTQAATTQRYAHLADNPLREATEMFGKKVGKRGNP